MRSKDSEKHKPKDMLLRVIRAAQILVKVQDEVAENAPHNKLNKPIDTSTNQAQKTQD